jgi:hypothetical protein
MANIERGFSNLVTFPRPERPSEAEIPHLRDTPASQGPGESDPLAFFVGVRNALLIMLGVACVVGMVYLAVTP